MFAEKPLDNRRVDTMAAKAATSGFSGRFKRHRNETI
jgi:hypothetical protein